MEAKRSRYNIIIRPRSLSATSIQLDDINEAQIDRISPHAFIVIRTSPGNHQSAGFGLRCDNPTPSFGQRG
jgi:hypothetical protein